MKQYTTNKYISSFVTKEFFDSFMKFKPKKMSKSEFGKILMVKGLSEFNKGD